MHHSHFPAISSLSHSHFLHSEIELPVIFNQFPRSSCVSWLNEVCRVFALNWTQALCMPLFRVQPQGWPSLPLPQHFTIFTRAIVLFSVSPYVSAVMVIVLLRYAHVIEKHQNCVLNTASLSTGWICAAGLIMVGNFQVRKHSEVPSKINSDEKQEQNLHSLTERIEL